MLYWDEILFPDMLTVIRGERYLNMTDSQIANELISLAKRAVNTFKFPKMSLAYSCNELNANDISGLSCTFSNVYMIAGDRFAGRVAPQVYNKFVAVSLSDAVLDSTNAQTFNLIYAQNTWNKFLLEKDGYYIATGYGTDNIFTKTSTGQQWTYINGAASSTHPGAESNDYTPVVRYADRNKQGNYFAPYKSAPDASSYIRAQFSGFTYNEFLAWINANVGNKTIARNFQFMCRFAALDGVERSNFYKTEQYQKVLDWGFTFSNDVPVMPTTTRYCFTDDTIGQKEISVILAWMKYYWADLMVSNADNFNNLYFDSNIQAFSPGNLLHNYKETCNMYRDQARELESEYYRSDNGKPTFGSITEED